MPRPALNFYAKFTSGNFKGSGSARRARAIFGSALLALQNFISAFKFYPRKFVSILKFAPQKSASVFKFSQHRFVLNLRSALRAVFAAAGALSAKILRKNRAFKFSAPFAMKNPVRGVVAPLNLMQQNLVRQNFAPQNFNSQSFARQNSAPQKIARRNRASKIAAPQNFARLNLAVPQGSLPPNSAFKFKASADV